MAHPRHRRHRRHHRRPYFYHRPLWWSSPQYIVVPSGDNEEDQKNENMQNMILFALFILVLFSLWQRR